jgi:signal peptidase II
MADTEREEGLKLSGPCSRTAFIWLIGAFLIDQASKWYLVAIADLDEAGTWPVTPFLNFTMAWNFGVSYGFLAVHQQAWLIAFSLGVTAMLWSWAAATQSRLQAASLGLIMGGALGNAFDRAWHGAVADFLDFHLHGWHWYIFNLADVFITLGVAGLVYESFKPHRPS